MKKNIFMKEIVVLAAMSLAGALIPFSGTQVSSYAAGQEGVCIYFDHSPETTEEEANAREKGGTGGGMSQKKGGHWKIGDTLEREIDGEWYRFRCIDQNYSDQAGNHRQAALFLCDTVIPASTGSQYIFEELPDGSHGYVFHPGPVVSFGDSNEYRYSRVRAWLQSAVSAKGSGFDDAEQIHTGISRAYLGSTPEGMYRQLEQSQLRPYPIGSQDMTDQLFILSVDEALEYRDWLWRFGGSEDDNPQEQIEEYCKGYWLRSPAGTGSQYDTGQVYVVDLVYGNLHPAAICPQAEAGGQDEEIRQTTVYGVRPAFALPQDRASL